MKASEDRVSCSPPGMWRQLSNLHSWPSVIQHHLFFPSSTGMTDKRHQLSQPKLFCK